MSDIQYKTILNFCEKYGVGLYPIKRKWWIFSFSRGWLKVSFDEKKLEYSVMWTSGRDHHYKIHENRCCFVNISLRRIELVAYYVLSFWEAKDDKREYYISFIEDKCKEYMKHNP